MKDFAGWRMVEQHEIVANGDVMVWMGPHPHHYYPQASTPEHGLKATAAALQYKRFMVYVPIGWEIYRRSGPVKLPMNRAFSEPLPLP